METLTAEEVTRMLLALGVLIATARMFGELSQRVRQPAVVGEIFAGVLLGPTILGQVAPEWNVWLFPLTGHNAVVLSGMSTVAITLFLLVAGMEVNVSNAWERGTAAVSVGVFGTVVPFAMGFAAAWMAPHWLGRDDGSDRLIFALFFATAMAISALPVIARTLMDLGLYRTETGLIVVSAAVLNDLAGWIVFAVVLGMIGEGGHAFDVPTTIGLTLAFAVTTLTLGRWLINRILPYLQAYTHWPGGELSFALVIALSGAAVTEWIGVHAIFGSFLVGVAVGDSEHFRERTRIIIDQFIQFFFAPLFFASIGLGINFATNFDATLVAIVLVIACAGKLLGSWLGARLGGLSHRDSCAVGFAMNARGAMEIILGVLALKAGVIQPKLFVALVVMALVTSMMSGTALRQIYRVVRPRQLAGATSPALFFRRLAAVQRGEAVAELARRADAALPVDARAVRDLARLYDPVSGTGNANGVALLYAPINDIGEPVVVVGLSEEGVDFEAPDDIPARAIFLILAPGDDEAPTAELAEEIGRLFIREGMLDRVLRTRNYAEFLGLLRSRDDRRPI